MGAIGYTQVRQHQEPPREIAQSSAVAEDLHNAVANLDDDGHTVAARYDADR